MSDRIEEILLLSEPYPPPWYRPVEKPAGPSYASRRCEACDVRWSGSDECWCCGQVPVNGWPAPELRRPMPSLAAAMMAARVQPPPSAASIVGTVA